MHIYLLVSGRITIIGARANGDAEQTDDWDQQAIFNKKLVTT